MSTTISNLWSRRSSRASTDATGAEHSSRTSRRGSPRRGSLLSLFRLAKPKPQKDRAHGSTGTLHARDYGVKDYRMIPRRSFLMQPFLDAADKDTMTIGTLYVDVVEARGLMSSDLSGRSDPYVKLCLTGRYLSSRQEWSEKLRIKEQTGVVKYSLNPVWNEEFELPVRRAGAVLKISVWDWDLSSADDPLGHFEVNIGEELLAQETMDVWCVLEAPRGVPVQGAMTKTQAPGSAADKEGEWPGGGNGSAHTADLDALEEPHYEDESGALPDSPMSGVGTELSVGREDGPGGSKNAQRRTRRPSMGADHYHESDEEARSCLACIDLRRKNFGEVRLKLWFQYDEFAETLSHVWPEEPLKHALPRFSPNQLYRKGAIFWEMVQPYLNFMKAADAIVSWTKPWTSLAWLVAMVVMLTVPYILIVVINLSLTRIVVSAYLKHCRGEDHDHDAPSAPSVTTGNSSTVTRRGSGSSHLGGASGHISDGPRSPARAGGGGGGGAEDAAVVNANSSGSKAPTSGPFGSILHAFGVSSRPRKDQGQRSSSEHGVALERSSILSDPGFSEGGTGMLISASAPDRLMGRHAGETAKSAPVTAVTTPTRPTGAASLFNSPTPSVSPTPRHTSTAALDVSRGGDGVVGAAGAGGRKIKKLLPTRVTGDPEIAELNARLGSTRKVPAWLNEVGKRVLAKDGAAFQYQVEKMGMELIILRARFHPLQARKMLMMVSALTAHMFLQLWLYYTGRFNLYLVLICIGQFSNKLYKKRGKALVAGIKEARRCRRLRLALSSNSPSSPSRPAHQSGGPSSHSSSAFSRGAHRSHPAFAPPGSTVVSDDPPIESPTLSTTSSFFGSSPVGRRRGTAANSDVAGSSGHSARDGHGSPSRGRRGTTAFPVHTAAYGEGGGGRGGGEEELSSRRGSSGAGGGGVGTTAADAGAASVVGRGRNIAHASAKPSRKWTVPWSKKTPKNRNEYSTSSGDHDWPGAGGGGAQGGRALNGNAVDEGNARSFLADTASDGRERGDSSAVTGQRARGRNHMTSRDRERQRRLLGNPGRSVKLRVRWSRVLGVMLTLVCGVTAIIFACSRLARSGEWALATDAVVGWLASAWRWVVTVMTDLVGEERVTAVGVWSVTAVEWIGWGWERLGFAAVADYAAKVFAACARTVWEYLSRAWEHVPSVPDYAPRFLSRYVPQIVKEFTVKSLAFFAPAVAVENAEELTVDVANG